MQGMSFTTDKIRSLVRKWQSLIEAHVDIKTTDGYVLRMFCIGFTKKRPGHTSKTCYAQVRTLRLGPLSLGSSKYNIKLIGVVEAPQAHV